MGGINALPGYSNEVFLEFEHGTSTKLLAATLEDKGVIRSRYLFLVWRALHPKTALQAGEYHFDGPLTAGEVFEKIRRGDIYYQQITVPEGSNLFDIADMLKLAFFPAGGFREGGGEPALIRDLDPQAPRSKDICFPPPTALRERRRPRIFAADDGAVSPRMANADGGGTG